MPKVSVIMCVFNGEAFVKKAIDSILGQTLHDFELIICNDASTDNTENILKSYDDSRIKVIRNEENLGPGLSRNNCILEATADYIVIQDADDYSSSDRLEILFEKIQNTDASIIGSGACLIDEGKEWGVLKHKAEPQRYDWIKSMQIVHASMIARREKVIDAGMYSAESKGRSEDYELLARLVSQDNKVVNIENELYYINYSKNDYSRRTVKGRFLEAGSKYRIAKLLQAPFFYYIYCLKPVVLAFIPKFTQFLFHKIKFRKA